MDAPWCSVVCFGHDAGWEPADHTAGEREEIGVTPNHPIWSEDRQAFVPAGALRAGEQLRSLFDEQVRVVSIAPRAPPEYVYNLEVAGEHVYAVSDLGTLAYNSCQPGKLRYDRRLDAWVSSGGLVYDKNDKVYGNRVKHVLHHLDPSFKGKKEKHSVFAVDRTEVLALIDVAWQREGIHTVDKAKVTDDFIYDFGRVIGTEGETKLKVVLKFVNDRWHVITAYPVF